MHSFLKALADVMSHRNISKIPERLAPLSEDNFIAFLEEMHLREPLDTSFLEKSGVSQEDVDQLLERINHDMSEVLSRTSNTSHVIRVENRNFVGMGGLNSMGNQNLLAVSGCAAIVYFGDAVYKYPLNEIFELMMDPELKNHRRAEDLLEEWEACDIPEKFRNKFGIPELQHKDGIYRMQYVGRSLDIVALQKIITAIDPDINTRLQHYNPYLDSLERIPPVQVIRLMKEIIFHNMPQLREDSIDYGEMLAIILNSENPCISQDHYDAFNSFLDFAWNHGFVYRDKIVDNLTLLNGKIYLIDFGMANSFPPDRPPDRERYLINRENLINRQLRQFIIK
ncbi:MAG: hypothetical protein HQM12_21465 [SAR324 cluster bacterium]|nr:hypothetical protein [SAR324 cluster bacterium]